MMKQRSWSGLSFRLLCLAKPYCVVLVVVDSALAAKCAVNLDLGRRIVSSSGIAADVQQAPSLG